MKSSNILDLKKYTWGFGIEHEMHVFHKPKDSSKNIKDFIIFDSSAALNRIIDEYNNGKIKLTELELKVIDSIPFETSGRLCNEKWVIKRVPVKMPEFVTWKPICSLENDRSIIGMTKDIIGLREIYFNILMKDKETKALVRKYGKLSDYPFGMTRYLKVPKIKNNTYTFPKNSKGDDSVRPEYNGSYHLTMTLPHKANISRSEFIKIHQNFCNQLQWIEPLLLTAYFTGDENAPGSSKKYVRGSFRVMIIGWGNFAGTDIRLLEKGIGRYAKTPTYWRDNFELYESEKLDPCIPPSAAAKAEKAITTLSSDIRTFGSTDPLRPDHRESGIGMTVPNGIEFRIFDHFQDKYIESLSYLFSLIAENSRVTKTHGYVYKNKIWIDELQNIMTHGYKAELSEEYIKLLREKLGLKIKTTSIIAYDVFCTVFDELYEKNKNGKWSLIFNGLTYGNQYKKKIYKKNKDKKWVLKYLRVPNKNKKLIEIYNNLNYKKNNLALYQKKYEVVPDVNKKGWQFAFMVKANRNSKIIDNFNLLSKYLNYVKKISFDKFKLTFLKIFGISWEKDVIDIAYFYNTIGYIKLEKNSNGTIKSIILKSKIRGYKNFNKLIIDYFLNIQTASYNILR